MKEGTKMLNPRKASTVFVTLIMVGLCFSFLPAKTMGTPLLPFSHTGDLFVLEGASESILRITPTGSVSIAVTKAEILAATGETSVNFVDKGIAFDGVYRGSMFFTEDKSGAILKLKRSGGSLLSILTTAADIKAAGGGSFADAESIAFSSDGFLSVIDDASDSVLKVNPTTGVVSVHTNRYALLGLAGFTNVDLDNGNVGAPGGVIYVASDGSPSTIFEIAPNGIPSVLTSDPVFRDLDVFMTRAPNGDIIVADDLGADTIFRVTPAGMVSTFLSESQLETVTDGDVDLEGGIAFDSLGNFFVADRASGCILKFDTSLNGSIWVSSSDIGAVTGVFPGLEGGIAFEPVPEPTTIVLFGIGLAGLQGQHQDKGSRR
jgi:outer membrane protein assembly factor BamB